MIDPMTGRRFDENELHIKDAVRAAQVKGQPVSIEALEAAGLAEPWPKIEETPCDILCLGF